MMTQVRLLWGLVCLLGGAQFAHTQEKENIRHIDEHAEQSADEEVSEEEVVFSYEYRSKDTTTTEHLLPPSIDLGDDVVLCKGESLLLDIVTPGVSYRWSDGTVNAALTIQEPGGEYWVSVVTSGGYDSDTIHVEYEDCFCAFYVPNAFTPNNDGTNDRFEPRYTCDPLEYTLQIFNQQEESVYTTTNPADGWDGKYKGELASGGVYDVVLSYLFEGDTNTQTEKGRITLIR